MALSAHEDAWGKPRASNAAPARVGMSRDGTRPLRFVGVYLPHGCAHELWKPGPGFELRSPSSSLAPFDDAARFGRSFKDALLVLDGLDLAAGIEVGTVGHDASRVILTGSGVDGKNPSIDQYLAVERGLGATTPHTSLTLAVGDDTTDLGTNVSYAAGGTPMPKWIDPVKTFDELFGKPLSGAGRAELAELRRRRQSVLDLARQELARLSARSPATDRRKLEQHATALREIEKRLSPPARECAAPPAPTRETVPRFRAYGAGEPY